jgi:hypothetical protein
MKRNYFFPFTLSIFPALSLLASNIAQVELLDTIRSFVISILLVSLAYFLARILLRSTLRAAMVSTFLLFLFFSYGHVYTLIEDFTIFSFNIGRHRYLLLVWLGVTYLGIRWLRRPQASFEQAGQALNITSLVLICLPIFQIIHFQVTAYQPAAEATPIPNSDVQIDVEQTQFIDMADPAALPDVYYIVLDMYTRHDVLQSKLDFDNSEFLDYLEDKGFYIASCSYSNYMTTVLSLGATLNLDYFQNLVGEIEDKSTSPYSFGMILAKNRVVKIYRELGYSIVTFESGFSPTEWEDAAYYTELRHDRLVGGMNPFEAMLFKSTVGLFLFEFGDKLPAVFQAYLDSGHIQHRDRILMTLDGLEKVPEIPGPKFVFAHILAPHNPFVFGPNGEYIRRHTPFTLNMDKESDNWSEFVPGYIGQVSYLNSRMEAIVDSILTESNSEAIIIIQGDHGIPTLRPDDYRTAILNAIYLPGQVDEILYPQISSVNTFRLILNTYFGMEYELLDDVSYYSTNKGLPFAFELIRAPDFVCPAEE